MEARCDSCGASCWERRVVNMMLKCSYCGSQHFFNEIPYELIEVTRLDSEEREYWISS